MLYAKRSWELVECVGQFVERNAVECHQVEHLTVEVVRVELRQVSGFDLREIFFVMTVQAEVSPELAIEWHCERDQGLPSMVTHLHALHNLCEDPEVR